MKGYSSDEDFWGEDNYGGAGSALSSQQAAETMPAKPKQTAADRRAAQAQRAADTGRQIGEAKARRTSWNRSATGRARNRDITDLATADYRKALSDRGMTTEGGRLEANPRAKIGMKKSQIYGAMGVSYQGHGYGDQQLPGLESEHAAPEPPRWEDLSEKQQARVHENLAKAGTSVEQMSKDFGAQLDQGHWRAQKVGNISVSTGAPVSHTQHFYDDNHPGDTPSPLYDDPKGRLRDAARVTEQEGRARPMSVVTAATALTSPNTKFSSELPTDRSKMYSPNVETAQSAIHQYDVEQRSPEEISLGVSPRGGSNQGYPVNSQKVGRMLRHIDNGGTVGNFKNPPTVSNPEGRSPFGPKTGPFVNSFDSEHPDYFVADLHSGGGGMLPHLSSEKPARTDEAGEPIMKARYNPDFGRYTDVVERDKSEREKGIAHQGFHSAADYAARSALAARGIGQKTPSGRVLNVSVRQPQAVQWGEEQLQRKEAEPRMGLPTQERVYPHLNQEQFPQHPGQGKLF
jgi:hypothetical protein